MENKWKSAGNITASSADISFAENSASAPLSVRTDWTMQRKVGIAMGVAGVLLFVVGLSPLILDSDSLKGDFSAPQATEKPMDPLTAMLSGTLPEATPAPTLAPVQVTDGPGGLPSDLLSFGESAPLKQAPVIDSNPSITPLPPLDTSNNTQQEIYNPLDQEVDSLLSAEQINSGAANTGVVATPIPTPIPSSPVTTAQPITSAVNSNVGMTDTNGVAFNNGGTVQQALSTENQMHNSAGLPSQNISSTPKTGPEHVALFLLFFSLFLTGAFRYRKELF